MILHLLQDSLFGDRAIRKFEAVAPGANTYLVGPVAAARTPIRLIKSPLAQPATSRDIARAARDAQHQAIIFHSLPTPIFHTLATLALLRIIPPSKQIAWIGWGYDYYNTLLHKAYPYPEGLLDIHTRGLLPCLESQLRESTAAYLRIPKRISRAFKHSAKSIYPARGFACTHINLFVPVLKREWLLARQLNPSFRPKYLAWGYHTVEKLQSVVDQEPLERENILIGNSATLTNNHLDAFEFVAQCCDSSAYNRVIVPLNYGDTRLTACLIGRGRQYFGDKFHPITELLEFKEYSRLIATCHTVVMNHIRQQATGNISMAALLGARIILNPRSMLTDELTDWGIIAQKTTDMTLGPLGEREALHNRNAEEARVRAMADPARTTGLIEILGGV
jgi:dTDP-N-acetylfucosamine:lipid II N-acetylfucosaminyltransferase